MCAGVPVPTVTTREILDGDAEALLELQRRLDAESSMMMFEPGERSTTVDETRAHVRRTIVSANSTIIVAVQGEQAIGYVEAQGGRYRRNRHSAYVVIGVIRDCQNRGIGRALLAALDQWASAHAVWRLELTVRADNERARRLYDRAGYLAEGTRRCSLRVDGQPVDEVAMARLLSVGAAR